MPARQHKTAVVRLDGAHAFDRLVDHQITPVPLHCRLEALHGLQQAHQLLVCLVAR